jgi:hypothetical protein
MNRTGLGFQGVIAEWIIAGRRRLRAAIRLHGAAQAHNVQHEGPPKHVRCRGDGGDRDGYRIITIASAAVSSSYLYRLWISTELNHS